MTYSYVESRKLKSNNLVKKLTTTYRIKEI